jgi:TRAP-type mannitol/chloroaromatic compound transport system substrate-binding protein
MTSSENKTVSRRSFLTKGSAIVGGAAATTVLATPAVLAQAPLVVRMQTSWPAADIWMDLAREYVERVQRMSGGRLSIDLLPAGAVVGAFQVMDGVSDGVLDAAHSVSAYWYGKHKGASLFGTGPCYGADPKSLMAWFYSGGGREFYRELTQDILGLNVVGLLGMPMPAQPFGWFKGEVNTVADLQGFRYRTVGLAADLLQSMGMSVSQLPGGEIVPAMERGVIDAFEFNNPTSDLRFGSPDVAKNYYMGSYHQAAEQFEFLFNKDFMDDLDDDLRAILEYGVEASATSNLGTALDNYSSDLVVLQEEHDVIVHRTSQEILEAQLEAWDTITAQLVAEDEYIARVVESQKAWAERVTFYELMTAPDYALAYNRAFPGKLTL